MKEWVSDDVAMPPQYREFNMRFKKKKQKKNPAQNDDKE